MIEVEILANYLIKNAIKDIKLRKEDYTKVYLCQDKYTIKESVDLYSPECKNILSTLKEQGLEYSGFYSIWAELSNLIEEHCKQENLYIKTLSCTNRMIEIEFYLFPFGDKEKEILKKKENLTKIEGLINQISTAIMLLCLFASIIDLKNSIFIALLFVIYIPVNRFVGKKIEREDIKIQDFTKESRG